MVKRGKNFLPLDSWKENKGWSCVDCGCVVFFGSETGTDERNCLRDLKWRYAGTSRRSVKPRRHCNESSARRHLSPFWAAFLGIREVIARCFKLISRTRLCAPLVRQEFSQKELAAKTVSLNLLNDQSTSEVRDSVVSQAGWYFRSAACRETISLSQWKTSFS